MEGLFTLFALALLGMIVGGFILAILANGRSKQLADELDLLRGEVRRLKERLLAAQLKMERTQAAQPQERTEKTDAAPDRRPTTWMGSQPPETSIPTAPILTSPTIQAPQTPGTSTTESAPPPSASIIEQTPPLAAQTTPAQNIIEQLPPQDQPAPASDTTRSEGPGLAWTQTSEEPQGAKEAANQVANEPAGEPTEQSTEQKPSAEEPVDDKRNAQAARAWLASEAQTERSRSLEEMLGTRLFIWIGAIAVALAGIFFLKWSYEFVPPPVKVYSAMGFSALMIGIAQWLRGRYERLAQGLCGAAIAILYGATLAGVHLFEFIPKTVGLGMMVGITAAAVGLSLRHGPFIALLGLLGGFATPALIRTSSNSADKLFGYLLLLQVGLLVLTRMKQWWWLMGLTLAGSLIWAVGWAGTSVYDSQYKIWASLFVLGTVLSFTLTLGGQGVGENPFARIMMRISGLAGIGLMLLLGHRGGFEWMEWCMFGILGVGLIAVGRLRPRVQDLAWFAGIAGILMTGMAWGSWAGRNEGPDSVWLIPASLGLGAAYMIAYYICMWGAAKPGLWAGASVASAILFTLAAYTGSIQLGLSPAWDWVQICLAMAAMLLAGAIGSLWKREKLGDDPAAWLLTGISAMVSFAMGIHWMADNPAWFSMGLAMQVPVVIFIGQWLKVPKLERLAWALTAAATIRLGLNPTVLTYDWSHTVEGFKGYFLNPITGCYLPCIGALALGAWLIRRRGEQDKTFLTWLGMPLGLSLEAAGTLLGFIYITLAVRHGFHPETDTMTHWTMIFHERVAYSLAWSLAGLGGMALGRARGSRMLEIGSILMIWLGMIVTVVINGFILNPAFESGLNVGGRILFNDLLYIYGVPMLACAGAWWLDRRNRAPVMTFRSMDLFGIFTLAAGFLLITMQAHHINQGGKLGAERIDLLEAATYCNVWLLAAAGMLWAHGRWGLVVMMGGARTLGALSLMAAAITLTKLNPLFDNDAPAIAHWFNPWLLYVYGLPMALYLGITWWQTRKGGKLIAEITGHAGAVMLAALLTTCIHQGFGGGTLDSRTITLHEAATYEIVWALAATGCWWACVRWNLNFALYSARWLAMLALIALLASLTVANPAYTEQHVGGMKVLNWLLYDYGLPMALVLGAAAWLHRQKQAWPSRMLGYLGMLLLLTLVTLQVRQGFRGDRLDLIPEALAATGQPMHAEQYAYSLAWVILSGLLLWAGVVKVWLAVRHAAMGIMSLAIVKVFIFDMSHLGGAWRILSLLGLGLSLIAVGFVYLKFVFRNPARSWEDK